MKDLKYYAEKSLNANETRSFDCFGLILEVDGEKFNAYEVSVTHCDLLFFTDKGSLNYVVDNYGGRAVVELFNVDRA
jgi:hypothetical protein